MVKARELMLEDLTESIKFYVEEQPLDLVYNIHKKYKWVMIYWTTYNNHWVSSVWRSDDIGAWANNSSLQMATFFQDVKNILCTVDLK